MLASKQWWGLNVRLSESILSRERQLCVATSRDREVPIKSSDQRERIEANRAVARIGWRPCRPVSHQVIGLKLTAINGKAVLAVAKSAMGFGFDRVTD